MIMPIHNVAPWVEQAVRSIVAQSLTDWELIVVDDGSDDGGGDLVEAFADPRIRLLRQPGHGGIVAALNRAAEVARGDHLARMDGDDISHPDRLQRQLEFIRSHPELDLMSSDYRKIAEDGKLLACVRARWSPGKLRAILQHGPCALHGTWLFRRSVLEELKGYRFDTAEDYGFLTRMESAGMGIGNVPEVLYSYRSRRGNTETTEGLGLRQVKTHAYVRRLYRRRMQGLPENHSEARLAEQVASSRITTRLYHVAALIVLRSGSWRCRALRCAGYAIAGMLSPWMGYLFFLIQRTRLRGPRS